MVEIILALVLLCIVLPIFDIILSWLQKEKDRLNDTRK